MLHPNRKPLYPPHKSVGGELSYCGKLEFWLSRPALPAFLLLFLLLITKLIVGSDSIYLIQLFINARSIAMQVLNRFEHDPRQQAHYIFIDTANRHIANLTQLPNRQASPTNPMTQTCFTTHGQHRARVTL